MKKEKFSVLILDIIEKFGSEGLRFTEIQTILYALSTGRMYTPGKNRGWWCSKLLCKNTFSDNAKYYRKPGLLNFYCRKNEKGKWVRNNTPHESAPFATIKKREVGVWITKPIIGFSKLTLKKKKRCTKTSFLDYNKVYR